MDILSVYLTTFKVVFAVCIAVTVYEIIIFYDRIYSIF